MAGGTFDGRVPIQGADDPAGSLCADEPDDQYLGWTVDSKGKQHADARGDVEPYG